MPSPVMSWEAIEAVIRLQGCRKCLGWVQNRIRFVLHYCPTAINNGDERHDPDLCDLYPHMLSEHPELHAALQALYEVSHA